MRLALLLLPLIVSGFGSAQDMQPSPRIRSLSVKTISTSSVGLTPVPFQAIDAAWKRSGINLSVENQLDIISIDDAKEVIRELYASEGHEVRVEHSVTSTPSQGVEVLFEVIELCTCS